MANLAAVKEETVTKIETTQKEEEEIEVIEEVGKIEEVVEVIEEVVEVEVEVTKPAFQKTKIRPVKSLTNN